MGDIGQAMTATVKLTLTGPMDQLRIVWQTGEALLESMPFREDPEGTRYNILVALQEMITNILRHGYEGIEGGPIELEFICDQRRFEVELRDRGSAFNPLDYDLKDMPKEDMPQQVGGYGIMIAMVVMDDVDYERRDGWNCLKLTKYVEADRLANCE